MLDFTRTDHFNKLLIFGQGIVYKGTIFISLSYWYWIGSRFATWTLADGESSSRPGGETTTLTAEVYQELIQKRRTVNRKDETETNSL